MRQPDVVLGDTCVGARSDPVAVTLKNVGPIALHLLDITASKPAFEIDTLPVEWDLAPGASTHFDVRFVPTGAAGSVQGMIAVGIITAVGPVLTFDVRGRAKDCAPAPTTPMPTQEAGCHVARAPRGADPPWAVLVLGAIGAVGAVGASKRLTRCRGRSRGRDRGASRRRSGPAAPT